MSRRIALLVSGASGMALPRTLLRRLAGHEEVERVHLVVSRGASQVLHHELGPARTGAEDLAEAAGIGGSARDKVEIHRDNELDAAIASGSYTLDGTAIVPCSAGSLGALATGSATTLIHRAGAVALKEGWPLVLGFRETPLTVVHIENMRRLAFAGATVMPPVPAFYVGGEELDRFLDHYAMRVMDRFGLRTGAGSGLRWGESGE
jgi:4-hydroxy-3-polyprenylbenzoate decarboxylase